MGACICFCRFSHRLTLSSAEGVHTQKDDDLNNFLLLSIENVQHLSDEVSQRKKSVQCANLQHNDAQLLEIHDSNQEIHVNIEDGKLVNEHVEQYTEPLIANNKYSECNISDSINDYAEINNSNRPSDEYNIFNSDSNTIDAGNNNDVRTDNDKVKHNDAQLIEIHDSNQEIHVNIEDGKLANEHVEQYTESLIANNKYSECNISDSINDNAEIANSNRPSDKYNIFNGDSSKIYEGNTSCIISDNDNVSSIYRGIHSTVDASDKRANNASDDIRANIIGKNNIKKVGEIFSDGENITNEFENNGGAKSNNCYSDKMADDKTNNNNFNDDNSNQHVDSNIMMKGKKADNNGEDPYLNSKAEINVNIFGGIMSMKIIQCQNGLDREIDKEEVTEQNFGTPKEPMYIVVSSDDDQTPSGSVNANKLQTYKYVETTTKSNEFVYYCLPVGSNKSSSIKLRVEANNRLSLNNIKTIIIRANDTLIYRNEMSFECVVYATLKTPTRPSVKYVFHNNGMEQLNCS